MRFRDYLKDHLSPIGGYILCVGLAALIIWLDPQHRVKAMTLWYAVLLVTLLASAFLIARYWRVRRFAARLQERIDAQEAALDWPLPGGESNRILCRASLVLLASRQLFKGLFAA